MTDKVISLEDYKDDRFLADAIAWLDELGLAQVIAMGLEDHFHYILQADLQPDVRLVLAKVLRATALAAVKMTCLTVQNQMRSGQTVDWKAVADMLEKELPAVEKVCSVIDSPSASTASDMAGSGPPDRRIVPPTPSAEPGPRR